MEFNKTKPIALGIAFTLALTPIHAITYADTNSDSASINVQTAQTEYKSGLNKIAARWPAKAVAQFYFY